MYTFYTEPYDHQRTEFKQSWDYEHRALFWEMGTGKSKLMVDTISALFQSDKADVAIIIAPYGVHSNWTESYGTVKCQWETHAPPDIQEETILFTFHSSNSKTKKWERSANRFIKDSRKKIISIAYPSLGTKNAKKLIDHLLNTKRTVVIADEAHLIKNPDAQRTKRVLEIGKKATYRRLLTGTLISQSMFDAYAPIQFLNKGYWESQGLKSFWDFKHYFGIWKTCQNYKQMKARRVRGVNGKIEVKMVPSEWKELVDYKNKDELRWHIEQFGSRVRKNDVLDLPPFIHEVMHVELSKEQRRLYDDMEKTFMAELEDGTIVETEHAMTRVQKMQQILQGFLIDEGGEYHRIKDCPRMDMLIELCQQTDEQVLIWTPFPSDIVEIESRLKALDKKVVSYYGDTEKKVQRNINKEAYQSGEAQYFISNQSVGGTGLDLFNTGIMVYYGHTYSLIQREQSEERVARPGLQNSWLKIDMMSQDTFEHGIIEAVVQKKEISAYIMRDYEKRINEQSLCSSEHAETK